MDRSRHGRSLAARADRIPRTSDPDQTWRASRKPCSCSEPGPPPGSCWRARRTTWRAPQRQRLRFSRSGNPTIERLYRTHWVSPELSKRKRERLAEKASRVPELVVIQPLSHEWTCHRCGGTGGLLVMENPGPACLRCVGLDDLEFLPTGDALLTRRAKAKSARSAVVVRFSKSRRRYERQGLLVEPEAVTAAQRSLEQQRCH